MDAEIYNKLIDSYIDRLTPGALFYKQLLIMEKVSPQQGKVKKSKENRLTLLIDFFDQLQRIDRIMIEDTKRDIDHQFENMISVCKEALQEIDVLSMNCTQLQDVLKEIRTPITQMIRSKESEENKI